MFARAAVLESQCSADALAQRPGSSERTLRRRLNAEGTRLAGVLAEVRLVTERQLLEDTNPSIDEIAAAVNHSHASAFFGRHGGKDGSTLRAVTPPTATGGSRARQRRPPS